MKNKTFLIVYGVTKQVSGGVDIVVFEDVDNFIVGRGMVRGLSQEIMTKSTIVIPCRAMLYAFGAEMASKVDGMNMKPINKLLWTPRPCTFNHSKYVYRKITEDAHIYTYDFSDLSLLKGPGCLPKTVKFTARSSGRMNCIVYWASIELWDKITISSNPSMSGSRSLNPLFQIVSEMKMAPPQPQQTQMQSSLSAHKQDGTSDTSKGGNSSEANSNISLSGDDIFSHRKFYVYCTKEDTVILSEELRHIDTRREIPVLISFPLNPKPALPPSVYSTLMSRVRCCAYHKGIELALRGRDPETTVLSINSGTGVVPMFAAMGGVERVVGTEERPSLWKASQQVLRANEPRAGAFNAVNIINSESTQIMPGLTPGLAEKASVCVYEGFGPRLLGNGLLAALDHARKYLLYAGCTTVPAAVTVYGALVDLYRTEIAYKGAKINISGLNDVMLGMSEEFDVPQSSLISKPFSIFKFNLGKDPVCNIPKGGFVNIDARITGQGVVSGVALWFDVDMDGTGKVVLTTSPQILPSSNKPYTFLDDMSESAGMYYMRDIWGQHVTWFDTPYHVSKGSKISLKACYTSSDINVTVSKYSREVSPVDARPLISKRELDDICAKRALLRVKLRRMLTKRADKVPEMVGAPYMECGKDNSGNSSNNNSRRRRRRKKRNGGKGHGRKVKGKGDDAEPGEKGGKKVSRNRGANDGIDNVVDNDYDSGDSDISSSEDGGEYDDDDDEEEENERYSDEDSGSESNDEDEDESEESDDSEGESDSCDSGDDGLDGCYDEDGEGCDVSGNVDGNGDGKRVLSSVSSSSSSQGWVKEDLSYLDDEYDEEDYDDDDEDDIWNILGAIAENAVELGIEPDIASDFILDLCRDF